jgi:palmitoyltransferase
MYTACYCGVVLGAAGSSLQKQINDGNPVDAYIAAVLGIGGFFGLFTSTMTLTSWRYIATNMTNIDMLGAKTRVYQLAVRIPRGSQPNEKYQTVNYPLLGPGNPANGQPNGVSPNGQTHYDGAAESPNPMPSGRDALATRTYAILKTEPGENPWDLGVWHNWQNIMGSNVLDWFLPLGRSPCVNHDSQESYYRLGPIMRDIRARYGIQDGSADETDKVELRNLNRNRA